MLLVCMIEETLLGLANLAAKMTDCQSLKVFEEIVLGKGWRISYAALAVGAVHWFPDSPDTRAWI